MEFVDTVLISNSKWLLHAYKIKAMEYTLHCFSQMPLPDLKIKTCFLAFCNARMHSKTRGIMKILLLDIVHRTALKINEVVEI